MANTSAYLHSNVIAGQSNNAAGNNSAVAGIGNTANAYCSFFVGRYAEEDTGVADSINTTNTLFAVGVGIHSGARATGFRVRGNGIDALLPTNIIAGSGSSRYAALRIYNNTTPEFAYSGSLVFTALTDDSVEEVTGEIYVANGTNYGMHYSATIDEDGSGSHNFYTNNFANRLFWIDDASAGTLAGVTFTVAGTLFANGKIRYGSGASSASAPGMYNVNNAEQGIHWTSEMIRLQGAETSYLNIIHDSPYIFSCVLNNQTFLYVIDSDDTEQFVTIKDGHGSPSGRVDIQAAYIRMIAGLAGNVHAGGICFEIVPPEFASDSSVDAGDTYIRSQSRRVGTSAITSYADAGDLYIIAGSLTAGSYNSEYGRPGNVYIRGGSLESEVTAELNYTNAGDVIIEGGAKNADGSSASGRVYLRGGESSGTYNSVYCDRGSFVQSNSSYGIAGYKFGISANGTESAPIIYRTTDTNTGIFFPAADQIAITAGGKTMMTFINDTEDYISLGSSVGFRLANELSRDTKLSLYYTSTSLQYGITVHSDALGLIAYTSGSPDSGKIRLFCGVRPDGTNPTNATIEFGELLATFNTGVRLSGENGISFGGSGVYIAWDDGDSEMVMGNNGQWWTWSSSGIEHSGYHQAVSQRVEGYNTDGSFCQIRSSSDADTGINFYAVGDMRFYAGDAQVLRIYESGGTSYSYITGDYTYVQSTRTYLQSNWTYFQGVTYVNTAGFYFMSTSSVTLATSGYSNYKPIVSNRGANGQAHYVNNGANFAGSIIDYYGVEWYMEIVNGIVINFYEA